MLPNAVIGLGANLADRQAQIADAARRIDRHHPIAAVSTLYECDAVGPPQPRYLNAAVLLNGPIDPRALLTELLEIERGLGRERRERWGPRTIDLDILFAGDTSVELPELTIPHARLVERTFALRPLLDLLPNACDPKTHRPYRALLQTLTEPKLRVVAAPSDWCGLPKHAKSRVDIA
jgi:2-amino-4-hydroxy-6-hydroxymethyldihydropteridine diphosphokinase